jgi:hypothetical protein
MHSYSSVVFSEIRRQVLWRHEPYALGFAMMGHQADLREPTAEIATGFECRQRRRARHAEGCLPTPRRQLHSAIHVAEADAISGLSTDNSAFRLSSQAIRRRGTATSGGRRPSTTSATRYQVVNADLSGGRRRAAAPGAPQHPLDADACERTLHVAHLWIG